MKNPTLRRIYLLYPSIGAWARSGAESPLHSSPLHAAIGMAKYLGPTASPLFMKSQHIDKPDDQEFLRSPETLNAMCAVIDAIYYKIPLVDGLFVDEETPDV